MTRTIETRNGKGQNFNMVYPDHVEEVHCDGFGDIMLSPSVVKLAMYQTRPVDLSTQPKDPADGIEHREVCMILSMPPVQLVQGLLSLLNGLVSTAQPLDAAAAEERAMILKLLSAVKITGKLGTAVPTMGESSHPSESDEQ